MCGLVGFLYQHAKHQTALAEEIAPLLSALSHRGPDAALSITTNDHASGNGHVALGHTRLSILDLSTSNNQPFWHAPYWMVFNGEIYNYQSLRQALQAQGATFTTTGDTEVIIQGFAHWGLDIFKRLEGMYAIAIYDTAKQTLTLARDMFGIKPLYYLQTPNSIHFASEIKALKAQRQFTLNPDVLMDMLSFGYHQSDQAFYQDVQQVPAGWVLQVSLPSSPDQQGLQWLKLPAKTLSMTLEDCLENPEGTSSRKLYEHLAQSVAMHALADVPVATALSGGLDSSIVTTLTTRNQNPLVAYTNTFSLQAQAQDDQEVLHAQQLSQFLQIPHHLIQSQILQLEPLLATMMWHLEEPITNIAMFNSFFLAQALHQVGLKVVLLGEGADELFGGYPWYAYALDPANQKAPERVFEQFTARRSRASQVSQWLTPEGQHRMHTRQTQQKQTFLDIAQQQHSRSSMLTKFLAYDMQYQLQYSQLNRVDRMLMAGSIEGRVPFLIDQVLKQAFNLKDSDKLKPKSRWPILGPWQLRENKIALAQALQGKMPHNILKRQKFGQTGTIDLYKTPAMAQLPKLYETICNSQDYQPVRDTLAEFICWQTLRQSPPEAKQQFLITLLAFAVQQFCFNHTPQPIGSDVYQFTLRQVS